MFTFGFSRTLTLSNNVKRRTIFYTLVVIWLMSFAVPASAQKDSISRLLNAAKQENAQLFKEINQANALMKEHPDRALGHLENALKLSFKHKNKRGEAYTYYSLGAVNYRLMQYRDAKQYFEKSEKLLRETNETGVLYDLRRYLGLTYEALGESVSAQRAYRDYIRQAETRKDREGELAVRSYLARSYYNSKQYSKALEQYLYLNINDPNIDKLTLYESLGKCYTGLKDTSNAIRYFKMAEGQSPDRIQGTWSARYYENASEAYRAVESKDKYLLYQKKAKSQNRGKNNLKAEVANNQNIANELIFNNNAKSAIPYLTETIDLSQRLGELKETGEAYRQLTEAYQQIGETGKARESFEKYKQINLKLMADKEEELKKQITDQSSFFEKEKQIALLVKEKELDAERIELLEEKQSQDQKNLEEQLSINKQQRLLNYILGTVLLLLLLGVIFMIRSSRQRKLANQLMAIRSLRSQMNPHFIFNSLNSVNSYISKSDNRSANKYLTEFARLMRLVLKHSQKDFVSLEDELEVLERYLKLEHLRFSDQFDYELNVDVNLDTSDLFVPPMLIQPYIENAIWHGLRYKEEKGRLSVDIIGGEESIMFIIEDDGIGRKASRKLKTDDQRSRQSTGMSNTRNRIDLLNKVNNSNIRVDVSDLNENKDGDAGTRVQLVVPLKDMKEERQLQFA